MRDWRELPPEAVVMVVDRPGSHTEPDTHEARPRPRAHGRNHMAPQVAGHPVCPA